MKLITSLLLVNDKTVTITRGDTHVKIIVDHDVFKTPMAFYISRSDLNDKARSEIWDELVNPMLLAIWGSRGTGIKLFKLPNCTNSDANELYEFIARHA